MALHFNYVQKSDNQSTDFCENILKSQKANYIQEYNDIFKKSYSKLTERLWQLNQNQTLFYYDYLAEGKHADDIIYDIFMTKFNQVYSEIFGERNNHAALINPIRRSMQRSVQGIEGNIEIYRCLKKLDRDIHFNNRITAIPDSTDISFGDIVQIGSRKFMVLSQDCDVVIRNNGTRKLDNFQLVEIEIEDKPITEESLSRFLKKNIKGNPQNPIVKETLRKYGLEDEVVEKVTNRNTANSDLSKTQISDLKSTEEIKSKTKSIISINCIWLDLLVLKRNSENAIDLSANNIKDSHEIRYATKQYISKKLDTLINSICEIGGDKTSEVADKLIKFGFNGLDITCQPQYSEQNGVIGFKIGNINRIGRLDRLHAMKILKTVVDDESRIPDTYISVI